MGDGNPFIATFDEHVDYGVAYSRIFTHLDENGAPISTAGYTVQAKVRQNFSTDVLLTLTGSVGGANGTVTVSATASALSVAGRGDVARWDGVYDILLVNGGSPTIKLVRGGFSIHPTASR